MNTIELNSNDTILVISALRILARWDENWSTHDERQAARVLLNKLGESE